MMDSPSSLAVGSVPVDFGIGGVQRHKDEPVSQSVGKACLWPCIFTLRAGNSHLLEIERVERYRKSEGDNQVLRNQWREKNKVKE